MTKKFSASADPKLVDYTKTATFETHDGTEPAQRGFAGTFIEIRSGIPGRRDPNFIRLSRDEAIKTARQWLRDLGAPRDEGDQAIDQQATIDRLRGDLRHEATMRNEVARLLRDVEENYEALQADVRRLRARDADWEVQLDAANAESKAVRVELAELRATVRPIQVGDFVRRTLNQAQRAVNRGNFDSVDEARAQILRAEEVKPAPSASRFLDSAGNSLRFRLDRVERTEVEIVPAQPEIWKVKGE